VERGQSAHRQRPVDAESFKADDTQPLWESAFSSSINPVYLFHSAEHDSATASGCEKTSRAGNLPRKKPQVFPGVLCAFAVKIMAAA
jgi:hypothetical protein